MNQKQHKHLSATCQCGKVKFEAIGPPILTGSCYCMSCQEAGRQFERLASSRLCSIPTVGQALSYIERIEYNARWGRSILKSVGLN